MNRFSIPDNGQPQGDKETTKVVFWSVLGYAAFLLIDGLVFLACLWLCLFYGCGRG